MTQLELMKISEPLADLYTKLESDLIENIAKYLATQNVDTSTAQWKIKALAGLGKLDKANIQLIAKYAGIAPEMLELALEQTALTAIDEFEPGFKELAKNGIIKGAKVPIEKTVAKSLVAYSKQATEQLNLVNTVMKYKAHSVASKLIKDTAELANKQVFLDSLNKATANAVTGIESRQSALRKCIGDMTAKGIPCFMDKLGREWSPEAYINMDIRTTCGNVAHQVQFDRMDDYDIDLIEVSSHNGSRPKCAKDQGRIFDRKNKSKKYRHWKTSSYGEPDGILGINCGHHIYPFIEGVSTQRYFPYDEDENAKQYKKFQQQRQLERDVRSAKRECMAMDSLGDKEGFTKSSVKLKQKQAKLKQYCKDNDLTYKADRTATTGYGRSISSKVTQANKKATISSNKSLKKSNDSGIIKEVQQHKKVEFVPAKSIEEAQEFSKKFVDDKIFAPHFKGEVNLKGIELDYANEINRSLLEISEQIKLPKLSGIKVVSGKSKQFKSGTDAIMAYSPVEKGIYINKDILKNPKSFANQIKQSDDAWSSVMDNIDILTGSQKELAQRYKDAGRSLVDGKTVNGLFTHELGHHIQWQVFDAKTTNALAENSAKYATKISGYATANRSEYMAESFVAYMRGETKIIDPLYVDYLNKLSITNIEKVAPKNNIIQYAKNGTSSLKTYRLPKNEYAKVMSEVATNITEEQKRLPMFEKAIGDYIYGFINDGTLDYRVISKRKIK